MSFRTHVKSTKQLENFFSWPNTEKNYHKKAHLSVTVSRLNNLKSWTPIKGPLKNIRHLYGSSLYYRPQPKCNMFFREILQKRTPSPLSYESAPQKMERKFERNITTRLVELFLFAYSKLFSGWPPSSTAPNIMTAQPIPPQYVPPRRHSRPYEDENPKPLVSNNKALLLNPYEFLKGVGFQPPSFSTRNGNLKSRCILPLRMDVLSLSGKGRGRVVFCCVVFFPTFRGRKRRGGEFLGWETKKSSKIFGVVLFFNGQKWNHYRVGGD